MLELEDEKMLISDKKITQKKKDKLTKFMRRFLLCV